jgi:hypothetical protein
LATIFAAISGRSSTGDPLGPLYFCLAFKEQLKSVRSELVLGYLDDVAMGGEVMCLLKDFLHLETVGKKFGLELNRSKFEVIAHHRDTGYVQIIRH